MSSFLLIILFSSCYHYGYLRREIVENFKDTSIKSAQFYLDRRIKIHGNFSGEQNVVKEDGSVIIMKSKNRGRVKIKKFTEGTVVKKDNDLLVLDFGSNVKMLFGPEYDKKGNSIYELKMTNVQEIGKKGRSVGELNYDGHRMDIKFSRKKHAFRHGRRSVKPAILFRTKTKHVHHSSKTTAEGKSVAR